MESQKTYVITGPTSGIGYETALDLAKHGTVILVGRSRDKLNQLQKTIEQNRQKAISVVCDISDITSVKQAAQQIISLNLPIAGLLNNAGIMSQKATKSAQGFDMVFVTNYLGAFALTEVLTPHLQIGANVVFIGSAIEDPERKPAKMMGMKGGRYISAEASARGEWKAGGSKMAGIDAYATSKLCVLGAAMFLSKENPQLHFNVVEPGIMGGSTNLGSDANISPFVRFLMSNVMKLIMLLPSFSQFKSTPQKAAKIITKVLTDTSNKTGIYFDEKGKPMQGSEQSRDAKFQEQVVAETRALLAKIR